MNKGIISQLLDNSLLSLTLSEKNQNIFKKYLSALKLNQSLLVLYLQDIGNVNIQALLSILTHNRSIQQLYFSRCYFDELSTILHYFKLNYYINIHLSISATINLSDITNISKLLLYESNNIIELFCYVDDEDCILGNKQINISDIEILDNSIDYILNYKLVLILNFIKPLIYAIQKNKLLFTHLDFITLSFNPNLIPLLKKIIQSKYNLSDIIMKRLDITNKLQFCKSIENKTI